MAGPWWKAYEQEPVAAPPTSEGNAAPWWQSYAEDSPTWYAAEPMPQPNTVEGVALPARSAVPTLNAAGEIVHAPSRGDVKHLQQERAAINYQIRQAQESPLVGSGINQALAAAPGKAFNSQFGAGAAQHYGDVNLAATRNDPSVRGGDPYGTGLLGYAANNPLTRGAQQALYGTYVGAENFLGDLAGAISPGNAIADSLHQQANKDAVTLHHVLPPVEAGGVARNVQNYTGLGLGLAASLLAHKRLPTRTPGANARLPELAADAIRSPATKVAAGLGTQMALTQAGTQEALGEHQTPNDVVRSAATYTAGNFFPAALEAPFLSQAARGLMGVPAKSAERAGAAERVVSGAGLGVGVNAATNAAEGRPLLTGAVPAAITGGTFGLLPAGIRAPTAHELGRRTAAMVHRENAISTVRDVTAKQDLRERAAGIGPMTQEQLTGLAAQVASEHGTTVDAILQAPDSAAEAGAQAADTMIAGAQQGAVSSDRGTPTYAANVSAARQELHDRAQNPDDSLNGPGMMRAMTALADKYGVSVSDLESATPPPVTNNGEGLPPNAAITDTQSTIQGLGQHQPTEPSLPRLEPGVTRDQLVQAWNASTTDAQKAMAAERIAAFDNVAKQEGAASETVDTTELPEQAPPDGVASGSVAHETVDQPIVRLPVADLKLSNDVPQFKSGANNQGVVEPLGGTFDERGTGPIQVWRRKDGSLEVVSGRHRLDLARRSGKDTIPAQVYDEANGFDEGQAASLDAELNIRDGQGKVADYVQYFQNPAFEGPEGRQAAESRGLLARSTGRRAYAIASKGAPELIAAHRAGELTDEAAVQLSQAAPDNEALQNLGMKLVGEGKPISIAANAMHAARAVMGPRAEQMDLLGFDDSAIQPFIEMSRVATAKQRAIREQIAAVQGAAKRPEKARALGVDVKNPDAVRQKIGELKAEQNAWAHWATDPELRNQVREEAGLPPEPREEPVPDMDAPTHDDASGALFSRNPRGADRDMFSGERNAAPERTLAPADTTGDMFGGPTGRERTDALTRERDAARNGKAGGREDAGNGGLFDGPRPEQTRVPEQPQTDAEWLVQAKADGVHNEDELAGYLAAKRHPEHEARFQDGATALEFNEGDRNLAHRIWASGEVDLTDPKVNDTTYGNTHDVQRGDVSEPAIEAGRLSGGDVPGQLELFTTKQGGGAVRRTKQATAELLQRIKNVSVGAFHSGIKRINSWQDAAHIIAPLRKSPQEQFMAVVADADRRPIAVIRHSIGDRTGAGVDPGIVFGSIAQIPGAKHVWFAHNHPSGRMQQSRADLAITEKLHDLMEGSGIETHGMIQVGPGAKTATHSIPESLEVGDVEHPIPPMVRNQAVPVMEGRIRKVAPKDRMQLTRPDDAFAAAERYAKGRTGAMLLDNKNKVVGFIPLSDAEMSRLRTGDPETGSARVMRDANQSGAASVVTIADDLAAGQNINALFRDAGIKPLDILTKIDNFDRYRSRASDGEDNAARTFHSTESPSAESEAPKFTADQVEKSARKGWGSRFVTKLKNAKVLHFIDTEEAVRPIYDGDGELVRSALGTRESLRGVKGIYRDGKAYILTDQVRSLDAVPGIVVHEAGLHYGYDRLTTAEDRLALRNRVNRAVASGDREVMQAWKHAADVGTPARHMHEETMAYLAEFHPDNGIVQRLLDSMRRGLNRLGIPMSHLDNDADAIRRMARDSLHRAALGDKAPKTVRMGDPEGALASTVNGAPVFSKGHSPYEGVPVSREVAPSSTAGTFDADNPDIRYSRDPVTRENYDQRIDALFDGAKRERQGIKVLDRADILDLLGHGDKPLHLVESAVGKLEHGSVKHPNMTRAQWKQVPEWIESPVAVFRTQSEKHPGRLVLFAPETIHGRPVRVILDPNGDMAGLDVHVAVNAYDESGTHITPIDKWVKKGDLLYLNQKLSPVLNERSGLRLPRDVRQLRGYRHRVLTERDLVNYRAEQGDEPRYSRDLLGDDDSPAGKLRRQAATAHADVMGKLAAEGYGMEPIGWTDNPLNYTGWRGWVERTRMAMLDKYDSVNKLQQAITDSLGQDLADEANVYRLENLMHGRAGDRLDQLDRHEVKPLIKSMRQMKVSPKLLQDYLLARHAEERNTRVAKINPDMPDAGAGITTQQAKDILDGKADGVYSGQRITDENRPKLEKLAKRIDRINATTVNIMEHSGQITPELASQLRKMYKYYIPLVGKIGEDAERAAAVGSAGRGLDIKGKPIKRALGRGEGNLPPPTILAEVIGQAQRAVIQAEKARVGRAVLKLASEHPNPDIWQVEQVELEWKYSEATGQAYLGTRKPDNDANVLTVVHGGEAYHVRLVDSRIRDAVKNLGAEKGDAFVRYVGKLNRWLAAVNTRYNPAFLPYNAIRDATLGFTGLAAEQGAGVALDAAKMYLPAMRASWRDASGAPGRLGLPVNEMTMDDFAREYGANGGKTGIVRWERTADTAKKLEDNFKTGMQLMGELRPLAATGKALSHLQPIVHAVELANDAVENSLRLAAYTALRKRGWSIDKAAAYAKDLTVNFNRKGQWGGVMNSLFLFYNAAVQGTRRGIQLMKKPQVQGFLGSLAALQATQTALLMSRQNQDGISDWDAIPDWKKQRALIIALPGKGHYFALPMPYEFGFTTYAGGRLMQLGLNMTGKEKADPSSHANVVNDLGAGLLQSFSPIPIDEGFIGLSPEVFQIGAHLYGNKNDFGRTIYNDQPFARYEMPASSMVRAGTATPYVWMAKALNRAGGGDAYHPPQVMRGLLDWSPNQLQYLSDTLLGGMGRFVDGSWSYTQKALAGNYNYMEDGTVKVDWQKKLSDMPILKRFGWETKENYARYDRFDDIEDNLERTRAHISDRLDNGDIAGARKVAREAGIFGDGWTIKRNKDGRPATRSKFVDGREIRVFQIGVVPGTLAAAYKEAVNGLSRRNPATGYAMTVERGLKDYNEEIRYAKTLPGVQRDRRLKALQDQRSALMGSFLRFYENRKDAYDTAQSTQQP